MNNKRKALIRLLCKMRKNVSGAGKSSYVQQTQATEWELNRSQYFPAPTILIPQHFSILALHLVEQIMEYLGVIWRAYL